VKKHLAVVVDWYGPYTETGDLSQEGHDRPGIYVAIGKLAKAKTQIQYVGISLKSVAERVAKPNHPINKWIKGSGHLEQLWIGEIASLGAGAIEAAERIHVFVLRPYLNQQLKKRPRRAVTVLNRWWKDDKNRAKRPIPTWPDLIDCLWVAKDRVEARLISAGKNVRLVQWDRENGEWRRA
jgi:hypothetical protein